MSAPAMCAATMSKRAYQLSVIRPVHVRTADCGLNTWHRILKAAVRWWRTPHIAIVAIAASENPILAWQAGFLGSSLPPRTRFLTKRGPRQVRKRRLLFQCEFPWRICVVVALGPFAVNRQPRDVIDSCVVLALGSQ